MSFFLQLSMASVDLKEFKAFDVFNIHPNVPDDGPPICVELVEHFYVLQSSTDRSSKSTSIHWYIMENYRLIMRQTRLYQVLSMLKIETFWKKSKSCRVLVVRVVCHSVRTTSILRKFLIEIFFI